jgi:hypothetical protein
MNIPEFFKSIAAAIFAPKPSTAVTPVSIPTPATEVHVVKASSFADPADVLAFKRCKARGGSDRECFAFGDNAIGLWGDSTSAPRPMCALPREDWAPFGSAARGKLVLVRANGREVVCELRDTMPHRKNIKNGAGIDLNPAAVGKLGLKPPIMIAATWQWV